MEEPVQVNLKYGTDLIFNNLYVYNDILVESICTGCSWLHKKQTLCYNFVQNLFKYCQFMLLEKTIKAKSTYKMSCMLHCTELKIWLQP